MTVLDRFGLHGKVAVVTGASSGLGVAAARSLAGAGAARYLVGSPGGIAPPGSHGTRYVDLNITGCMSSPRLC